MCRILVMPVSVRWTVVVAGALVLLVVGLGCAGSSGEVSDADREHVFGVVDKSVNYVGRKGGPVRQADYEKACAALEEVQWDFEAVELPGTAMPEGRKFRLLMQDLEKGFEYLGGYAYARDLPQYTVKMFCEDLEELG